jgi:hypothetical protein
MIFRTLTVCVLLAMSPTVFADEAPMATVGQAAADFIATGIDGKKFKVSDKLKAGDKNIVLLFSRASW